MLGDHSTEEAPDMVDSLLQAAHLIGVSYNTILRWKDNGQIRCVQRGGRWAVPMSEVERLQGKGISSQEEVIDNRGDSTLKAAGIAAIIARLSDKIDSLDKTMEVFMRRQQELATVMTHNSRVVAKKLANIDKSMEAVLGYAGDIAEARTVMMGLARELRMAKETVAMASNLVDPTPSHSQRAAGVRISARSLVSVEDPPQDHDDETFLTPRMGDDSDRDEDGDPTASAQY